MRWWKRNRRGGDSPATPRPIDILQAELDRLAAEGSLAANNWAARVRAGEVDELLKWAAPYAFVGGGVLVRGRVVGDPLIRAAARFDLEQNGQDWTKVATDLDVQRSSRQAELLTNASRRLDERLARLNARQGEQALAAVRSSRPPDPARMTPVSLPSPESVRPEPALRKTTPARDPVTRRFQPIQGAAPKPSRAPTGTPTTRVRRKTT